MARVWNFAVAGVSATAALLLLSACDNGPSAVAKAERAEQAAARDSGGSSGAPQRFADAAPAASGVDHRDEPAMKVDGKAVWAATKRYSAEEAAQRGFDRNGKDFGAADVAAYAAKAHAFVTDPPSGVETLKRPNGDTLYYDARSNVFAVANKDGLPKTMFKPDDGARYWTEQKDRGARQTARRSERSASDEG